MGYTVEEIGNIVVNGISVQLEIIDRDGAFTTRLTALEENKVAVKYCWQYEAKSLQSVKVWINKIVSGELVIKSKYYESGIFHLPHNEGYGNLEGKRQIVEYN